MHSDELASPDYEFGSAELASLGSEFGYAELAAARFCISTIRESVTVNKV